MIKQLVNTFSSVASEYSLFILEEHLLKHLSNLKTVFNLLTDLSYPHGVQKHDYHPDFTLVVLSFALDLD